MRKALTFELSDETYYSLLFSQVVIDAYLTDLTYLTHLTSPAPQMRRNSLRRYIQKRMSHRTNRTVSRSIIEAYGVPNNLNTSCPKWVLTLSRMKPWKRWAMQYMAMEFIPTTSSGKLQPR